MFLGMNIKIHYVIKEFWKQIKITKFIEVYIIGRLTNTVHAF